jgi:Uma2 family endonuclease
MSSAYSTFVGPPGVGDITLPVAPLSTEQYLRMIDAGIFDSSDKVELIGGFITPMAPVGPEHNGSLFELTKFFAPVAERFVIAVQATIAVSEGQVLEPDFALLTLRADKYMTALPRAADVLLLIESAASSIKSDRHVKLPIYAAAGIPEYWIVDLNEKTLEVHREPVGEGYAYCKKLAGDDAASPLACPEVTLRVGGLFA